MLVAVFLRGNLGFNTQPPEGGWNIKPAVLSWLARFNTQPPEGGWIGETAKMHDVLPGFNTQPPEGGWAAQGVIRHFQVVSTHSRPKAAGATEQRA